jgi:DNA-binding MarR family transcriptional regulator
MSSPGPAPARPAPGPAPSAETVSRLRLAVLRLGRRLRQNAAAGITPSQLAVLATLDRRGPLGLGDLAAHEGVQPPSATRMVDNLEAAGLVTREASRADRRAVVVQLTAKGRRRVEEIRRRRDAWLAERLGRLNPEELDALEAALPVLEALLESPDR